MIWNIVVIVFAAIMLLKGMLALTLPKKTIKTIKKITRNEKRFKFLAMIEALIGLIILIFVLVY